MLLYAADAMEVGDSDDEDEEPAVQPPVAKEKIQTAADVAAVLRGTSGARTRGEGVETLHLGLPNVSDVRRIISFVSYHLSQKVFAGFAFVCVLVAITAASRFKTFFSSVYSCSLSCFSFIERRSCVSFCVGFLCVVLRGSMKSKSFEVK